MYTTPFGFATCYKMLQDHLQMESIYQLRCWTIRNGLVKQAIQDISITNLIQTTEENEVSKSLNFGIDKSIGVTHSGSEDIPMDPQIAGQSSWGKTS